MPPSLSARFTLAALSALALAACWKGGDVEHFPSGYERDDYELVTTPAPEPGDGEVLVRTLAITIGAGQRAGLQGSASYAGAPVTGVVMGGGFFLLIAMGLFVLVTDWIARSRRR